MTNVLAGVGDAEDDDGEHAPHSAAVNGWSKAHSCSKAYGVSSRSHTSKARSARNGETPGCSPPTRPQSATIGDALGGIRLGSKRGQSTHIGLAPCGCSAHKFRIFGQVGQDSHWRPAVWSSPRFACWGAPQS